MKDLNPNIVTDFLDRIKDTSRYKVFITWYEKEWEDSQYDNNEKLRFRCLKEAAFIALLLAIEPWFKVDIEKKSIALYSDSFSYDGYPPFAFLGAINVLNSFFINGHRSRMFLYEYNRLAINGRRLSDFSRLWARIRRCSGKLFTIDANKLIELKKPSYDPEDILYRFLSSSKYKEFIDWLKTECTTVESGYTTEHIHNCLSLASKLVCSLEYYKTSRLSVDHKEIQLGRVIFSFEDYSAILFLGAIYAIHRFLDLKDDRIHLIVEINIWARFTPGITLRWKRLLDIMGYCNENAFIYNKRKKDRFEIGNYSRISLVDIVGGTEAIVNADNDVEIKPYERPLKSIGASQGKNGVPVSVENDVEVKPNVNAANQSCKSTEIRLGKEENPVSVENDVEVKPNVNATNQLDKTKKPSKGRIKYEVCKCVDDEKILIEILNKISEDYESQAVHHYDDIYDLKLVLALLNFHLKKKKLIKYHSSIRSYVDFINERTSLFKNEIIKIDSIRKRISDIFSLIDPNNSRILPNTADAVQATRYKEQLSNITPYFEEIIGNNIPTDLKEENSEA